VELIAIGNGTASRETYRLGAKLTRLHPKLKLTKVVVSEAGARHQRGRGMGPRRPRLGALAGGCERLTIVMALAFWH
jgi:hypothetical protein